MSKQNKIIVIVLALVIVGLALYFLFRKPKAALSAITEAPGATPAAALVKNDDSPFDFGSRGDNVRRLQMALNRIKAQPRITEDGVFGAETRAKLLTSVSTQLSQMPISSAQLTEIIKLGNNA